MRQVFERRCAADFFSAWNFALRNFADALLEQPHGVGVILTFARFALRLALGNRVRNPPDAATAQIGMTHSSTLTFYD